MVRLGVNIDHVATLRRARGGLEPDPVKAAFICEEAGCDSIVCHLREDRRHIIDEDVRKLRKSVRTSLNLEMSIARDIVDIACDIVPDQATLVPEKREELTTEGGLDVAGQLKIVRRSVVELQKAGISVSLFIDPSREQIDASVRAGAAIIELHTGEYANARSARARQKELKRLTVAAGYARGLGLEVNAGHGLNYGNVSAVVKIDGVHELNIGHSIISEAIFTGLGEAVKQMRRMIK